MKSPRKDKLFSPSLSRWLSATTHRRIKVRGQTKLSSTEMELEAPHIRPSALSMNYHRLCSSFKTLLQTTIQKSSMSSLTKRRRSDSLRSRTVITLTQVLELSLIKVLSNPMGKSYSTSSWCQTRTHLQLAQSQFTIRWPSTPLTLARKRLRTLPISNVMPTLASEAQSRHQHLPCMLKRLHTMHMTTSSRTRT